MKPLGRVLRKRYAGYIAALHEGRCSEKEIAQCIRSAHRKDSSIKRGRCPKCGNPIVRYGAARTSAIRATAGLPDGPELGVGGWVMLRCSTQQPPGTHDPDKPCDFMVDRFEAAEAN